MPSMPWIKLYTDILDDPKIGRMDAAEKWHFVALCVLAGECDAEGYLVNGDDPLTIEDIAWRLREDIEQLDHTMTVLQQHGLVTQDPDGTWFVTNFSKRQGRSQSEKRKLWRERKRRQREREQGDPNEDDGSHDGTPENVTRDTAENHAGVTPLEGEEREREIEIESREDSSRVPERDAPASQPPANAGADAPIPDPPPKERPKRKKDPPPDAVDAYRRATNLFPRKSLWPGIVQVVGDDPDDVERWHQVCLSYVAMGWNPKNIKGMLEHYVERRVPGDDSGKARASPGKQADDPFAGIKAWAEKKGVALDGV